MDDQNPTQQAGAGATDPNATGGAQPVSSDTSLPWMNFAPETPADTGSTSAAGGAATGDTTTPPAPANFDPFGNPFATSTPDAVASAFAPSTTDGSMPAAEPAAFTPSEPTAFTASEPVAAPAEPLAPAADATLPWSNDASSGSKGSASDDGDDSLAMLAGMKKKFDEEEAEFNRQIEEHNDNIEFEKEAISKLRSERSDRIAKMRDVVRNLEDMLGIKKPQENRQERPRHEETRKAERVQPKKQASDNGINDFLAA